MKLTWHGHAFFEIETRGKNLVVDPFTDNPKTQVRPEDLEPDLVLVTHGHYDHAGCVTELDAPVLANFEIATWLERKGRENVTGMNIGGTYRFGDLRIWMAPAVHSAGLPSDDGTLGYGGSAYGFVIDDGRQKLYHSGDTALFGDMKTVIGDIVKPDIALLPIGDLFTMDPEHAAIATKWLGVRHVVPMHYNTFPDIEVNVSDFVERVGRSAKVHVMDFDTSIEI